MKLWKRLYKMPSVQWSVLLSVAQLLSGCATVVPNILACSGVEGIPGIAALCRRTNTDEKQRISLETWLEFLYAQEARPDPKNPGKMLPPKGPAVCVSAYDYQRNDTAISQLCAKGKCTFEQKKAYERIKGLVDDATKGGSLPKQ